MFPVYPLFRFLIISWMKKPRHVSSSEDCFVEHLVKIVNLLIINARFRPVFRFLCMTSEHYYKSAVNAVPKNVQLATS